jgi:hypothetical protein
MKGSMATVAPKIIKRAIAFLPMWICCGFMLLAVYLPAMVAPVWASPKPLGILGKDGLFIYFPKSEADLAQRLADSCPAMLAFLTQHGLPPDLPLHILLDQDLDAPRVEVRMIPHHEIRIPLRAPGVLEDGYLEPDPWRYFLFMGLAIQALYAERSKIPAALRYGFGEIISPNVILPDWTVDGISHLLYEGFAQRRAESPWDRDLRMNTPTPDLDEVSNHPEIWPGRLSYRIYGRPFIRWLESRFGWDRILAFIRVHGGGIIPIEIDSKTRKVFGTSPAQLWRQFKETLPPATATPSAVPLTGYWPNPLVYWNDTGVYPGLVRNAVRGRYGFVDQKGRLWLSRNENGVSRVTIEKGDAFWRMPRKHMWDPGPGAVAVTRQGRFPCLVVMPPISAVDPLGSPASPKLIAGPPGVIQLSGPVADANGRVAVAGNSNGNWDIWLHDGAWHRITTEASLELDPWFEGSLIIFASNATGKFQIHTADMQPLTRAPTAAMLPRAGHFLQLGAGGWTVNAYPTPEQVPEPVYSDLPAAISTEISGKSVPMGDYSPGPSILPNYIAPDLYVDVDNFQVGLATQARDVSGEYAWDAGVRYAVDDELFSWRLGGKVHDVGVRATYYDLGYTPQTGTPVDETRHEVKLAWSPSSLTGLEVGVNWRRYAPDQAEDRAEQEYWGSLQYDLTTGHLDARLNADWFSNASQSLYGELVGWFGERITTMIRLQAGKTWGNLQPGHNGFRVGGSQGEGYFTQRTSRLFALRGFDANILEASQAATASVETFWPLAKLQAGYGAWPVFLHNLHLGTFADSGIAADHPDSDGLLISAGFELITGMELAWGFMADLRLGWAWPLSYPDDLVQDGPVFLIQIGRPL